MTVGELKAELAKHPDELDIVFHDEGGCAYASASLVVDGTCDDTEVLRITLLEDE